MSETIDLEEARELMAQAAARGDAEAEYIYRQCVDRLEGEARGWVFLGCPHCDGASVMPYVKLPPGVIGRGPHCYGQCTAETRRGTRCQNFICPPGSRDGVMTCAVHMDQAGFGWPGCPGMMVGPMADEPPTYPGPGGDGPDDSLVPAWAVPAFGN